MGSERNDRLRAAREATPSRLLPGRAMTRSELADLVVEHVWRRHGIDVPFDRKYVAKLEAGEVRWPSARYRRALREVLGARSDHELGFVSANLARTSAPLAMGAPGLSASRRRAGDDHVDRARELLAAVVDRSRELRDLERLATAAPDLSARAESLAHELWGALVELCLLAARLRRDAGDPGSVTGYHRTAMQGALLLGDELLASQLLASLLDIEAGTGSTPEAEAMQRATVRRARRCAGTARPLPRHRMTWTRIDASDRRSAASTVTNEPLSPLPPRAQDLDHTLRLTTCTLDRLRSVEPRTLALPPCRFVMAWTPGFGWSDL